MYSLALYIFVLGLLIACLFSKKIRKMVGGTPQAFYILSQQIRPEDRVVWFHAASLGEFEQGRPLMERLRREHPEYKILLTFFSPSGYEVRKNYTGADVICYLPFDTPGNVHSFLRRAHPEIAIFIKYEFWRNYLTTLHRHGVRVYSVSSIFRPSQHFFKWWGTIKPLDCFDQLFVQNEESRRLLNEHGIDKVTVAGDTRFDRVLDIRNAAADLPLVERFVDCKPCFIAGSSWGPDEEIYIRYFAKHKDWKLIIAPHVISESHLAEIEDLLVGRKVVRYSSCDNKQVHQNLKDYEVLIVDCFGKLSSIYRYGKVALVGGGFGVGIHNVPEAAVYGIPVIFGPNNKKFQEAQALLRCGGSFEYTDHLTFRALMDRFITDEAFRAEAGKKAGDYIHNNAGAADICYRAIFDETQA